MKTQKRKLEKRYLESNGQVCPFCGSTNLTTGGFDFQANIGFQGVNCSNCDAEWTDEYTLTSVTFEFEIIETE